MEVPKTDGAGKGSAPRTEPMQAPKSEPKRPQDNTAARQVPKETKQAVQNSFGDVPKGGHDNQPAEPPGDARSTSSTDTKVPHASGNKPQPTVTNTPANPRKSVTHEPRMPQTVDSGPLSPADPRVQSIFDSRLPAGRRDLDIRFPKGPTFKEKLDAETPAYVMKAAQQHYDVQRQSGEALDAVSRFYLNTTARYMAEHGVREDDITPDKLAEIFDKDRIGKNLEELAGDPAVNTWFSEQQANAVEHTIANSPDMAKLVAPYLQEGENHVNALRRMQSDYMSSQEFADGVDKEGKDLVADAMKTLTSLGLGEKEMLGVANTLAENIRSKTTPEAPKMVIDPDTNKALQTQDGYSMATLPDGTFIGIGSDGKAVADKQGNPYVYNADGTFRFDVSNAYVQYDPRAKAAFTRFNGIRYMVDAEGNYRHDAQGRPLVIDIGGGAPVVLGDDGKVVTDAAGNRLVFDPDTGKAVTDPVSGNAVVVDPKTNAIVQAGADGKIFTAPNGDPYAADPKSGAFVMDTAGRYVLISKENVAPGILPGYVVDDNGTKIVVSPNNGKPIVDPSSGKTAIFTPEKNAPELVPLDSSGKPRLSEDGKSIVYDLGGSTVVRNTDGGPNWLVNAEGGYAGDGNDHYIGVGPRSGLASPVDAKGAPIQNGNGQVPLWDPKTNAFMTTADGNNQVVLDKTGSLLETTKDGGTVVEDKTGLPYLVDPDTLSVAVNPDTGRSILLDRSGAAIEYNADDGTKYLVNLKDNTTVKTAEGLPIVIDDTAGMPVAVNADGSRITNPETGNTVVYNLDGKPAADPRSGFKVEITPDGKARLIDPQTLAPVASYDKSTGGLQLYNKDGSELAAPGSGNKVQIDPNGHRVEVDPATGKFATDGFGNTLILGPDNAPLKTPEGLSVVIHKEGAPVAAGTDGKLAIDPVSKLPRVVSTDTGKVLEDPAGKATVVVDPVSGAPVHVEPKTGEAIKDTVTGLAVVANAKTGEQLKGPNGEPVGVLPKARVPVYVNTQNNTLTIADPSTGKAVTNPKTGAQLIIDPQFGVPIQVLADKDNRYFVADNNGRPKTDGLGNPLYLDKDTGQIVIKLPDGKMVDARNLQEPKRVDLRELANAVPAGAIRHARPGAVPVIPLPVEETQPEKAGTPPPVEPETPLPVEPVPVAPPPPPVEVPPPVTADWASPDYVTSPAEQADFIEKYKANYEYWKTLHPFLESYETEEKAIIELLKDPANEPLRSIPVPDLVALRIYTRGGLAQLVNHAMYAQWPPEMLAPLEPYIRSTQSALNQMRNLGYAYDGPAFRVLLLNAEEFEHMFSESETYFRNRQFMSTSVTRKSNFEGNVILNFNNVRGVDVESISSTPEQKEIIAQPNAMYRVDTVDDWASGGNVRKHHEDQFDLLDTEVKMHAVDEPLWPAGSSEAGPSTQAYDVDEIMPAQDDAITPAPLPQEIETTVPPETGSTATGPTAVSAPKAVSNWKTFGTVLNYAGDVLGIATGALQSVAGGVQIDEGIRNRNPYDVAAGSFNVAGGAFAIGSSIASLAAGAAAAAMLPLAAASIAAGGIAGIIDFVNSLDDDEQFADELARRYEQLGILKEGWRPKAEAAHRDGFTEYYQPSTIA